MEGFQPRPFGCEVGSQFHHGPRFQPPSLKFRTSGFPQYGFKHQAPRSSVWSLPQQRLRLSPVPTCPQHLASFTPTFGIAPTHFVIRLCCAEPPGERATTWAQRSSLEMGCVVPSVITSRPHPPVWRPPPHFPVSLVIESVFGIEGPSCPVSTPSGLSLLYFPRLPPSVSAGSPVLAHPSSSVPALAIG